MGNPVDLTNTSRNWALFRVANEYHSIPGLICLEKSRPGQGGCEPEYVRYFFIIEMQSERGCKQVHRVIRKMDICCSQGLLDTKEDLNLLLQEWKEPKENLCVSLERYAEISQDVSHRPVVDKGHLKFCVKTSGFFFPLENFTGSVCLLETFKKVAVGNVCPKNANWLID